MNYSGDDTSLDFWIIVVDSGIRYLPQDVGSVLNTMFNFRKQVITQNNFALIFRDKEKKKVFLVFSFLYKLQMFLIAESISI